jgi:predicted Zn-dependent protease
VTSHLKIVRRAFGLCVIFLCAALAQPPDAAGKSQRAKQLMADGRFIEAARLYRELIKAIPGNPGLELNLAMALHMAGQDREAIPVFESVLKVQPDAVPALVMGAASHLQTGNPVRAVALLQRAAKLDPQNPQIRSLLAESYAATAEQHRKARRYKQALEASRQAVRLDSSNAGYQSELAASLYLARDYPAAVALLRKLEPTADNTFMLGDSLLNQQKPDEAIPFLVKALDAAPKMVPAHASLGRAYMQAGQPVAAVPHLELAAPADTDGSVHYQLSRAYQSAGRKEDAAKALRRYKELSARPKAPSR